MSFLEAYLQEFDHEAISTGKSLERVPAEKFDWAPHEKSMKLGPLANHIVSLPGRVRYLVHNAEIDVQSPEAVAMRPPLPPTTKELVERWRKNLADMHAALGEMSDEKLTDTFTLMAGPDVSFSAPKRVMLRGFVLNHLIHHRGQLSVYLRLLDVPVPSIYGPSADEKM
jgi:uncharacterized damage-inducible protein DinB